MLDIGKDAPDTAKCHFTTAILPQHVDEKQAPTKRKPFSTIHSQPFTHTLALTLPRPLLATLQSRLGPAAQHLHYARVHLKPLDLITGAFFATYIKAPGSNVLLLSAGRAGLDNSLSLLDGVLRLDLDRATYERAGLVGSPVCAPLHGRKHAAPAARFAVVLDLRLPSMVRGKKGFNRVVYAFEHVLTQTLTCLFCDLRAEGGMAEGPMAGFAPFARDVLPEVVGMEGVRTPSLPSVLEQGREVEAVELLEWLRLLVMDSPRAREGDDLDPYLCRYDIPDLGRADEGGQTGTVSDLVCLRWHGFIPAAFVARIMAATIKVTTGDWFALHADSFCGKSYTILRKDGNAMIWECEP